MQAQHLYINVCKNYLERQKTIHENYSKSSSPIIHFKNNILLTQVGGNYLVLVNKDLSYHLFRDS